MGRYTTYSLEEVDEGTKEYPTSKRFMDLKGEVFSKLTVMSFAGREKSHSWWYCQCECGVFIKTSANNLKAETKTMCGFCGRKLMSEKVSFGRKHYEDIIVGKFPSLVCLDAKRGFSQDSWLWHCTNCDVDFSSNPCSLSSGEATPCLCDNGYKFVQWTAKLREDRQIIPKCERLDIKFEGWVDEYKGALSRIKLSCPLSGHDDWSASINNFTHVNDYGCPSCGVVKRSSAKLHSKTKISTEGYLVHGDNYDYGKYQYTSSINPSTIKCNRCDTEFKQSYDNHINKGRGCPSCAGYGYNLSKRGIFYIQSLDDKYLKYGVTNISVEDRMKHQSKFSVYEHKIIFEASYDDGKIPLMLEREIKKNFTTSVCSREDMPHGFTETCHIEDFERIVYMVKELV